MVPSAVPAFEPNASSRNLGPGFAQRLRHSHRALVLLIRNEVGTTRPQQSSDKWHMSSRLNGGVLVAHVVSVVLERLRDHRLSAAPRLRPGAVPIENRAAEHKRLVRALESRVNECGCARGAVGELARAAAAHLSAAARFRGPRRAAEESVARRAGSRCAARFRGGDAAMCCELLVRRGAVNRRALRLRGAGLPNNWPGRCRAVGCGVSNAAISFYLRIGRHFETLVCCDGELAAFVRARENSMSRPLPVFGLP